MKKSWFSLLMLGVLVMFLAIGCSNEQAISPDENPPGEEELSLDKPFGGFNTEDETVGFGDPDMIDDFPEDVDVADPFSVDPVTVEALNSDSIKAFFVRITWGLLEGDSTATEVLDWSGFAEINKGTLVVLKTILFEPDDFIQLPRVSRQRIDFTSHILGHFDGIAIAIIDNDTTQEDVEGTLTFTAGNFSTVLSFSDLDSLDMVESVDVGSSDLNYQVSIVSQVKEVEPFEGGFMAGHWVRLRPDGGIFKGRWINSIGTNAGFLRGIWGINRRGERVFFGKFISLTGEFRGLMAGEWEFTEDDHVGVFRGRWVNRSLTLIGVLGGHFTTGRPGDGRGFFQGRWEVRGRLD